MCTAETTMLDTIASMLPTCFRSAAFVSYLDVPARSVITIGMPLLGTAVLLWWLVTWREHR